MRRGLWIGAVAVAALAAGLVFHVALQIKRQSALDEARPADVIVVLGAAEYSGRPSPVLKARLDYGLELFHRQLAPRLLTTGGAGGDPIFTEAEVARDDLVRQGVPPEAVIVEEGGATTMQSTAAAAEILHRMGLRSCLVVSDGYHIFRAKKMLEAQGLRAYGAPRPEPPRTGLRHWWLYTRQAVGYLLWKVGIRI